MKIKRILSVILSAALIGAAVPCFAEAEGLSVELRAVGDSLLITGSGCRSVLGTVSVRIADPDGNTCYLNQIQADADGSFSLSVGMKAGSGFGEYTAYVRERSAQTIASDSEIYLSGQTKLDITADVNAAENTVGMLDALNKWKNELSLTSVSDAELSNASIVLFEQRPQSGYEFDGISAVILRGQSGLASLNASSAATFAEWVANSGEMISNQPDVLKTFNTLKLSDKQAAAAEVLAVKPFAEISAFRAVFAEVMEKYAALIPKKHLTLEAEVLNGMITVKGNGCVSRVGGVTFRAVNPDGTVSNLNQLPAKDDGSFEYSFMPSDKEPSGNYNITAYGRGLNDSTSVSVFCLTRGTMKKIALELDAERTVSGIVSKLNKHKSDMQTGLTAAQTENAAQLIFEQLARGGAYSYEEYVRKIEYSLQMMKDINDADWLKLAGKIADYGNALLYGSTQIEKYNGLTEGVRNQLCKELIKKRPFELLTGFRRIFDTVVSGYKPSSEGGGSGGSSGGGSGGSGGGGSFSNNTTVPNITTVTNPTTSAQGNGADNSDPFTDLNSVDWASASILMLYKKGVISPAEDGRFRPLDNVTREEFIKLVVSAFDLVDMAAKSNFGDADSEAWYYPYISSAYERGIVLGYEDGTFGIGKEISRQEMAMMIYRAAVLCGYSLNNETDATEFADSGHISEYARGAVAAMQASGIISGDENGMFRPADSANRAEAAKVLAYILGKR